MRVYKSNKLVLGGLYDNGTKLLVFKGNSNGKSVFEEVIITDNHDVLLTGVETQLTEDELVFKI